MMTRSTEGMSSPRAACVRAGREKGRGVRREGGEVEGMVSKVLGQGIDLKGTSQRY
jgi:hypothetical protein